MEIAVRDSIPAFFDDDEYDFEDGEDEFYPSSDGEPIGETDWHIDLTLGTKAALMIYFADRPNIYIAGNNFIYYMEGNPKAVVSPDGYVLMGSQMRQRSSYFAWKEEGRLPNVVFEFTSAKTRRQDLNRKYTLYEQVLQVPEYFLFDPTGVQRRKVRLRGFRLKNGKYRELALVNNRLYSEQLDLELVQEGRTLRFFDPVKQEFLLTPAEQAQRIKADARRMQADKDQIKADTKRMKADAERIEADEQHIREMAAENERLRAELEALRRQRE